MSLSRFYSDARDRASKPGDPDRQGRAVRAVPREAVRLTFAPLPGGGVHGRFAAMLGVIEVGRIESGLHAISYVCHLPGVAPKWCPAGTIEAAQDGLRIVIEAWFEAAHHPLPGTVRSA